MDARDGYAHQDSQSESFEVESHTRLLSMAGSICLFIQSLNSYRRIPGLLRLLNLKLECIHNLKCPIEILFPIN